MTIHIGAKQGEIAETVLLPGDPYRARWAAENFLEGSKLVNEVRGMLGFTGTYKGNPVTIQGSGMGMPSLSKSCAPNCWDGSVGIWQLLQFSSAFGG